MSVAAVVGFLKGPGLVLVALGWVAKALVSVAAFRWWRARKGERA